MNPFKQTKTTELPSYILTEARIPADEGDRLLGRIVADFNNPTDEYRPQDPRPALMLGPKVLEIIDTEFSSLLSVERNKVAQAKVGLILKVDFDKLAKEESSLKSSFVRSRFLPQHRDAFEALMQQHGDEVLKLLRDNKGKGYMVVGYKSCVNGQMGKTREYADGKKVDINIPTGAAVTAATHGAVNLGNQADVGVGLGSQDKQSSSTTATMVGEQIFAVRYRIITLVKGTKGESDFGDVQRVSREHGVFGEEEEGKFITEDDTSDDGVPEVVEEEEVLLCGDAANESDSSKVIQSDLTETGSIGVEYGAKGEEKGEEKVQENDEGEE
ncbi:hypothetical protein FOMA001_g20244 [Fusarium oxysporum f. sp. matthiolae]|nr:hypothetical protein FOMA001_g20244 [Fusarium oxysporum f. sp. matthiolae]